MTAEEITKELKKLGSDAYKHTLRRLVSAKADVDLDLAELKKLLQRVSKTTHTQPRKVHMLMNEFVIAAGSYVKSLSGLAIETGTKIGKVTVEMKGTACKVPFAPEYIAKAKKRGTLEEKRKSTKC
ncbi:MAG: hypothetical protein FJ302_12135 [Planctomycetes bacterium]|nr:hypothetical protein [Planctomycetota bacterium]